MERTIKDRLEYYNKFDKEKHVKRLFDSIGLKQDEALNNPLQEKPLINNRSQKLFSKLKTKRDLSPNVLKRFEEYELRKKEKMLKMRIQNYVKENRRRPKAEDLMKVDN
jgi:hypothetical protein